MSQPLDRNCRIKPLGPLAKDRGEFWVENAFLMPTSGHNLSAFERNRLFLNVGGKRFLDATFASPAGIDSDSRSVIAADFDGDLRPDLLVASAGGGPLRLFRNNFPRSAGRLAIHLRGTKSNRFGIGARIIAEFSGRRVVAEMFPANGFMGQGPPGVILGTGSAQKIDRLTIEWPSGHVDRFRGVAANQTLHITEGPMKRFEQKGTKRTKNGRPNSGRQINKS